MRRRPHPPLALLLALALLCSGGAPAAAGRGSAPARGRTPALELVKVDGKQYYRTFRVTSPKGFERITDQRHVFRFFNGDGQYGQAFYLFNSLRDAKKFRRCERARGAEREVIAEVLLPRAMFDKVQKAEIPSALDWGMQRPRENPARAKLRDIRLSSHLVSGTWAPSPYAEEPFYRPMNGARQIGVVQRGEPSILNQALIRALEASP